MIFGTQIVLYDYHHGILNRMLSQETITDVHLYLDCLNFNCCLVKATITRCDLSPRFFCNDATLLCEFVSDKT